MLNYVVLQGRLTADPELRTTQSGTPVTNFTVAVERDRAEADGTRLTDFFNIVAWRQTAEFICKYFTKGRPIIVSGRLEVRSYTDRDNNKRSAVEVQCREVQFAGPAPGETGALRAADFQPVEGADDDVPF